MESLTNIYSDKENSKTGKLLKESQTQSSAFSPARTPLSDVRNKLPHDNYVFNIRKTLYGTPLSSSKKKTPRSIGKGVQSKSSGTESRETTPKRNVSMKPASRRRSDKKIKVVRFNLKEEVYGTPEYYQQDGGQTDDGCHGEEEEEKLDKEIEGFISSILKLTVEEIRQESQMCPSVNIIPPTPSPVAVPHEVTTTAKELSVEYKEATSANSTTYSIVACTVREAEKLADNIDTTSTDNTPSVQVETTPVNLPSAKDSPANASTPSKSPRRQSVVTPTNVCVKVRKVGSHSPASPRSGLSVSIVSPTSHTSVSQDNIQKVVDHADSSLTSNIFCTNTSEESNPAPVEDLQTDKECSQITSSSLLETKSVLLEKVHSVVERASSPIASEVLIDSKPVMVETSMTTDSFTPQKCEQTVQVNPDVISTASSPFLLTLDQETCDVSMVTEKPEVVSQGMTAKPLCEDKMTWIDFTSKKTSETSMTPVKVLSKNGKRLTAEEVRRQHPRAIANQLDTTLVCNERLKIDLKHAEKERDKLKCIVKDLRMSLSSKHKLIEELESQQQSAKTELEEMHFSVVRDFQTKVEERDERIATLEGEVNQLKSLVVESEVAYENFKSSLEERCELLQERLDQQELQHLAQVEEMTCNFEKNNYKAQFERSQQMIRELQAQLDEFADIMVDLEVTEKLQGEVHSTISETHKKLRYAGVRNAEMRKKLITEYVGMQKIKKELTQEVETFRAENDNLREECDSLAKSVSLSHNNNAQLESLYTSTARDLLQATSHVCQMNVELVGARKALQDLLLTKDVLVQHLQEMKDKEEETEREMQSLHQQLRQLDFLLQEETQRKEDWERIAVDGRTLFEEKAAEYEQVVLNLERTLENREQDIDIMEKDLLECREIILEQRQDMAHMEAEYKEVRDAVQQEQLDQAELQTLRDHVEFLEAERNMLIDSLRDSEEKIRNLFFHQTQNQKTICEQQQLLQESKTTLDTLQAALESTRSELITTRNQTREVMWKHNQEVKTSGEALSALEEKMATILGVLKKKVSSEDAEDRQNESSTHHSISSESLVSKVLKAVNNPSFDTSQTTSNTSQSTDTSFSWSKSRPRSQETSPLDMSKHPNPTHRTSHDGSSMDSGFSNSFASPGEVSRSKLGYSQASAFAPVRTKVKDVPPPELRSEDEAVDIPLVEQTEVLSSLLSDIISKANILEKASELSLQDLKGENGLLRNKVTQLEGEVGRLLQDRNMKTEELTEANQLIEDLKDRIREMGERIIALSDYQFDQRSIRQEVERLLGEVKRLEGEKEILVEQLNQTSRSAHQHGAARDVHTQRELVALKTKNQQLFLQMSEERDRYQEMGNKAARKMKILEDNWRKAEAEVIRFDELVDSIQKILEDNKDFISKNPELLRLMRVINGEDTFHHPTASVATTF